MTVPRVDMIQVPGNYDVQSTPVPSTNDVGKPKKPKKAPKPKMQQRPLKLTPKVSPKKPVTTGQAKPIDAAPKKATAAPPKKTPQVPEAIPKNLQQYTAQAEAELDAHFKQPGFKIVGAELDEKWGDVKYKYKNPSTGKVKTWFVSVDKFKQIQFKSQLAAVTPKKIPGKPKPLAKPKPAKPPKSPTPGKHAVAPIKQSKSSYSKTLKADRQVKDWNQAGQHSSFNRISERMEKDPDWQEFASKSRAAHKKDPRAFAARHSSRWARTSRDASDEMHYLQLAAAEEFSLPSESTAMLKPSTVARLKARSDYKLMMKGYRSYVRAQYSETQDFFKRKGVKSMTLSRGFGVRSASKAPAGTTFGGQLETSTMTTQPLSSYSSSVKVGHRFADGKSAAFLSKQEVPVERIFGLSTTGIGTSYETELVVIGGKDDVVDFIAWRGGTNAEPSSFGMARDALFPKKDR